MQQEKSKTQESQDLKDTKEVLESKETKELKDSKDPKEPSKSTTQAKSKAAVVLKEFRDINDFSITYEVGDSVSHFDESRLEDLRNKGIVE